VRIPHVEAIIDVNFDMNEWSDEDEDDISDDDEVE
jgi:hypothetical protein